jgi:hypothetical protein
MTIKIIKANTSTKFFKALEELTPNNNHVFRGHKDSKWHLTSTLARHRRAPYHPTMSWDVDEMLRRFIINLKITGIDPPFERDVPVARRRRARLEFGRHYGIPSPLIDFSRSPYVAAYFAFAGVRPYESKKRDQCAVYCLNTFELALIWAQLKLPTIKTDEGDSAKVGRDHSEIIRKFIYAEPAFNEGYPANDLKFIRQPASWNRRMQRQLGSFLYDSMNYEEQLRRKDLEDFLTQKEEAPRESRMKSEAVLTKIVAPHKIARDVMERLDLMGISATHLYDDAEGAAIDVINGYVYSKNTADAWDMGLES